MCLKYFTFVTLIIFGYITCMFSGNYVIYPIYIFDNVLVYL